METGTLRRTPLYQAHLEAGAKLVPFAGWEMPVPVRGHQAGAPRGAQWVRCLRCLPHGRDRDRGPQAASSSRLLLSNDVSRIEVGGAQYSCLCREDGGVLDDLFTYRLGDHHFLTVTNAANHERDLEWFQRHADGFDADVHDRIDEYAMLAVQGPEARRIVGSMAEGELPARIQTTTSTSAPAAALVCGTGYTGEDGVEVLVRRMRPQPRVWEALSSLVPARRDSAPATPCGWRSTTASTATT